MTGNVASVELGVARDIGVSRAVHRYAVALIIARAADVAAVNEGRADGVHLGHKGVMMPPLYVRSGPPIAGNVASVE